MLLRVVLFRWESGSRLIETIRNFVQLTPDIGTAGQPSSEQFQLISQAGYEVVINLAMPEHPDSISNEGELVMKAGMSHYHIPVPFDNPDASHVLEFCRLMQSLEGRKVFIHCIMNYRVSAFMFHYLHKLKGYSEDAAKSPMFDLWQVEPQWADILELSADDIGL